MLVTIGRCRKIGGPYKAFLNTWLNDVVSLQIDLDFVRLFHFMKKRSSKLNFGSIFHLDILDQ